MSAQKEVSIKINEQLFKRLLRDQQEKFTRVAVERAFDEWRKANAGVIRAQVQKYLDKEIPIMLEKELPRITKSFYCGFDS